jgi:hypothetical protein
LRVRRLRPVWVGLEATHCCEAVYQPPLPTPPAPVDRAACLRETVAQLQARYGVHVIRHGVHGAPAGGPIYHRPLLPAPARAPVSYALHPFTHA